MTNDYSERWFSTFLGAISASQTMHEADFLREQLPLNAFRRVLDVCCGRGRHSRLLSDAGYDVRGIDRDAATIEHAREAVPVGRFFIADMRDLKDVGGEFDAVICLWQSFGYFDDATNTDVLRQFHSLLRPGGRLILDVYSAEFFRQNLGEHTFTRAGQSITETKSMQDDRLHVALRYHDSGAIDQFDWQVYDCDEMCQLASDVGFKNVLACSSFDANLPISQTAPRMQLVFEKKH